MKTFSIQGLTKACLGGFAFAALSLSANATTLNDIFAVADRINVAAKESQATIEALTEETRERYSDHKVVLKEIEGLQVYNRQLQRQIANQEREMAEISASVDEVTVIERQITPLMIRMIDSLEQFIELDIPFQLDERRDRVSRLRDIMERADVAVSEKFSQVLNAYQIENEYGRTLSSYSTTIEVAGQSRIVDVLQIGRISLVYQTSDGEETGVWNNAARQWEVLEDQYQAPVRQGIRMERKQASLNLLPIPVRVE